ncbi:MAG: hypothetical protein ACREKK_11595, partial [Candidatus Methylomirabilales bacterium]
MAAVVVCRLLGPENLDANDPAKLALFSLVRGQREDYLLPLLPPASLLVASAIEGPAPAAFSWTWKGLASLSPPLHHPVVGPAGGPRDRDHPGLLRGRRRPPRRPAHLPPRPLPRGADGVLARGEGVRG